MAKKKARMGRPSLGKRHQVGLRLRLDMLRAMRAAARKDGVSLNAAIVRALEEWIGRQG